MTDLLIATQNQHKIQEFREMFSALPNITWKSLADVGLATMEVEETGDTFAANAILKAQAYGEAAGIITFADDSGLVVDALDGAPGVYSARYGAPERKTDQDRYEFLLNNLKGISERAARFVCVIAVYVPRQPMHTAKGTVEGNIATEPRGKNGFGYDPVFLMDDGRTLAEYSPDEKHTISHRGRALQAVLPYLQDVLNTQSL